jgi:hypothetical protein
LGEHLVEPDTAYAHARHYLSVDQRVGSNHVEAHCMTTAGDRGPDVAESDQAECLAVDRWDVPEQVTPPATRIQFLMKLRQLSRAGQQQQHGVIGDVLVAEIRVGDRYAKLGRGGEIEVVIAVVNRHDRPAAGQAG